MMIADDFKAINAAMKETVTTHAPINLQLLDAADCVGTACLRYGDFVNRAHIHAGNAEAAKVFTSEKYPMDKLIALALLAKSAVY